jgi:hypothetical protein
MRRVFALTLIVAFGCTRKQPERGQNTTPTPTATAVVPSATASALLKGATCPFPDRLDKDATIASGCVVDVVRPALVESGATLTIEPGVTLRFHEGTYLELGHKGSRVVAKGNKDRPIVFTSALAEKHAGDWVGIVVDDAPGVGTTFEHAVVEYAGRERHGGEGALTAFGPFPEGRVTVRDTVFRHEAQVAVANRHPRSTFAAFERNRFEDCPRDLRVTAAVLGSIGEGNVFGSAIDVLGGTITRAATWPASKAPFLVSESIYVNGIVENGKEKTKASLTIAPDSVLKLARGTWIEVGTTGPASFTADKVTFTSGAEKQAIGDWVGFLFGDRTVASRIQRSRIEYAGAEEHGGDGAVTILGSKTLRMLDLTLSALSFAGIGQAHVSSNGDGCDMVLDPKNGMVFVMGVEPCK